MMAGTYNQRVFDSDSDSDTDFGCGWSKPQKKAETNWREVYEAQRCEYTGTVTELLKSALKQKQEGKDFSEEAWLILPSTHEYYRFQHSRKPNSIGEDKLFLTIDPARGKITLNEYEKSDFVFAIHVNKICPLTDHDSERLLPIIERIIKKSEENLNKRPRTCVIS